MSTTTNPLLNPTDGCPSLGAHVRHLRAAYDEAPTLYRSHAVDGRQLISLYEGGARTDAGLETARTADVVAVERFDVDRGQWVLVELIGARS